MNIKDEFSFSTCHAIGTIGSVISILLTIHVGEPLGGSLLMFVHIPSFLITTVLTFFLLLSTFQKRAFAFMLKALVCCVAVPHNGNEEMVLFSKYGRRYAISSGIVGFLIGLVQLIAHLDLSTIGYTLALIIMSILYAVIMSIGFRLVGSFFAVKHVGDD